jgi:hypothetical protein
VRGGEGKGGVGSVPRGGRRRSGEGGGQGSVTWAGTARTWQLWAASTAAGGTCLTGAAGAAKIGEDGGARPRGRGWLTGGA